MAKKQIKFTGRSKKLSKLEIETLTNTLIDRAFAKREKAIESDKTKFADWLLVHSRKDSQPLIDKLPSRYTYDCNEFSVRFEEMCNKIWVKPTKPFKAISSNKIIPYLKKEDRAARTRFEKITNKESQLAEQHAQDKTKTKGALHSLDTTKKLFEGWPEAYTVYLELNPHIEHAEMLPAIQRDDLNRMLGL